jgi:hypothetical protein
MVRYQSLFVFSFHFSRLSDPFLGRLDGIHPRILLANGIRHSLQVRTHLLSSLFLLASFSTF